MGSSQSKRTKEGSTGSSYRRSVVNKIADSPVTSQRRTPQQHSLRTKTSFIRTSSSPNLSQSSAKQQKQQQQQQVSSVNNNPPVFAGVQSNSFFLPKDWQAEDADHGLHFALKKLFASNVLSLTLPKFCKNATIIELGCNHGSWILDMATQFPECQFIGFDTSMERLPEGLPPLSNVTFQVANTHVDGIPLKDESVDVVNLRAQNALLDHDGWQRTLEEARRVLKPQGIIHILEYCYRPKGTVMIESFAEAVRGVMTSVNRDTDRATKLGPQLSDFGFQVIQSLTKKVYYGPENGKLGEAFAAVTLHRFEIMAPVLAPGLGLSLEDYRHRVEMVVAQSVNTNTHLTWYAYAARKLTSSVAPPPSPSNPS